MERASTPSNRRAIAAETTADRGQPDVERTLADVGGYGWTQVDAGELGWAWVSAGGRRWTQVEDGGLEWARVNSGG